MLDLLKPAVQRCCIVVCVNRDGFLNNDWAVVNLFINEVDGDPGERHSVLDRTLDGVGAGEGWEQSRVDVDDRVRKSFDGARSKNAHEPRQNETFGAIPIGQVTQGCCERCPRVEIGPRNDLCRYACICCPLESPHGRSVGDNDSYDVSPFQILNVDERLEVAAATGDKNGERERNVRHRSGF